METVFAVYPGLVAGFSSRQDGTMAMNGGFENRQNYLKAHGLDPWHVVHAGLCHGATTRVVTMADGGRVIDSTDGLITAEPSVGLAMTAADCLLVYVYDPTQQVIGLAHAGSKGLAQHVLSEFLKTWQQHFHQNPAHLVAEIGPSICPEHYTVSLEQGQHFTKWPDACEKRGDFVHLDLRAIARQQLIAGGIPPKNIHISTLCTFEDPALFSYRRDHPKNPQLQVGFLVRQVEH